MEPALQRRVQRYGWDKASPFYERFWQGQLKSAQDLLLELAAIHKDDRILDIACGTGLVSFRALEQAPGGSLLGTDISEKMVELAGFIASQNGAARARFERMDAEALEVDSESFDAALCALGLMYMPSPVKALQEMHRALAPGGRAVVAVWGERRHCGWADIFEIVDRHVSSEVCPMFFNLGNPGALEISLRNAGFSHITTHRIQTTLHYKDEKEALGAAFDGGPVALAYHKFSESVKDEVHADYLASIAPYRNGEGFDVPGEFVVARAEKRKGVIKISVMYPYAEGKTFNMEYYETTHMPMVAAFLGSNLVKYTIERGLSSGVPNQPLPFMAIGTFYVKSLGGYQAAIAPNRSGILADIPKFTDIVPLILVSEVVK